MMPAAFSETSCAKRKSTKNSTGSFSNLLITCLSRSALPDRWVGVRVEFVFFHGTWPRPARRTRPNSHVVMGIWAGRSLFVFVLLHARARSWHGSLLRLAHHTPQQLSSGRQRGGSCRGQRRQGPMEFPGHDRRRRGAAAGSRAGTLARCASRSTSIWRAKTGAGLASWQWRPASSSGRGGRS